MSSNVIAIEGNLCSDPEAIGSNGMVKVRMAIGEDKNRDGERYTTFATVLAFKQSGEFLLKYGRKGSAATVFGNLNLRQYEHNGQQGKELEVKANRISIPKVAGADAPGGDEIPF